MNRSRGSSKLREEAAAEEGKLMQKNLFFFLILSRVIFVSLFMDSFQQAQ